VHHQRQVGGLSNGDKNVEKHKKIQKKKERTSWMT
jgi:hypothetical protein